MRAADAWRFATSALLAHRLRTFLSVLGVAIGVASVMLLTSIGEGTRQFIIGEFTQFGTNILVVNPGKVETFGVPGIFGGTSHKLTLADAEALERIPGVELVLPLVTGLARVEGGERGRSVYVIGCTDDAPDLWKFEVRRGRFLESSDLDRGRNEAVLGSKLARELFGDGPAVGQWVRVAGSRLRVVGITKPKGQILGFDMDDVAYVAVAKGMSMFNLDELNEVDVVFAPGRSPERVTAEIKRILTERHRGQEDFTVTSQQQMLEVFGDVMNVVTIAVAAIGAISLVVGAVGILTMMWISVGERTHEVGLLRALGARADEVRHLFLLEAVGLACTGCALGLLGGFLVMLVARVAVPGAPVHASPGFIVAAVGVSVVTGLLAGVAPARRAAAMDPALAMRAD